MSAMCGQTKGTRCAYILSIDRVQNIVDGNEKGRRMGIEDREWFREDAKRREALPWNDSTKVKPQKSKTLIYAIVWIGLIVFLYAVMAKLKGV